MAGVVTSVLTDRELARLQKWASSVPDESWTSADGDLLVKVRAWSRSVSCEPEKCATGYCRNQPACPRGKCSPPTPGFPAPDVGRKRESCGYTCAQLRGRDDV